MINECLAVEVEVTLKDAINFVGADIYAPLNESDVMNTTSISVIDLGMCHIFFWIYL